ncbi:hypothetical protein I6E74_10055 [Salinibacterium sp. SWN139]|uniref:hypothetical protein n=1 Tax=Salinibacterium sp. SWN139 TaxID=2792055 RepID=UPI0018CFACAB|nr:hypothetical protein [Salinibacterium sp. SWN139]MBH0054507.1 hypothetical protein [Salinibacterium sp. SWN139]
MPLHEESPARTIAVSAALGGLGGIPGLGGLAGTIQGSIQAAARARDENFWAMVVARISSLEAWTEGVADLTDPEFLASAHRLFRVAQETSDDGKRTRLAAALANAGPWCQLPRDERERMERVIADLTTREVGLLKILAGPGVWLRNADPEAFASYEWDFSGTFAEFLESRVARGERSEIVAVYSANDSLQEMALVGLWDRGEVGRNRLFSSKVTSRGQNVLTYLESIGS